MKFQIGRTIKTIFDDICKIEDYYKNKLHGNVYKVKFLDVKSYLAQFKYFTDWLILEDLIKEYYYPNKHNKYKKLRRFSN